VTVAAWPNTATLAALPYKATVPVVQVGTAITDARGIYTLKMDMSHLGRKYREPHGSVSVEIKVATPGSESATWNMSVPRSQIGADRAHVALRPLGFNLDAHRVSGPTVSAGAARLAVYRREAVPSVVTTKEPTASPGPPQPCVAQALAKVRNRPERFLDVHAWSGGKVRVVESSGSEHSVGVGVSGEGKYWEASGEVETEWASSTTVSTPWFSDNRWVGNSINYRKFATWCPSGYYSWSVRSTGLHALLPSNFTRHRIRRALLRYCAPYDKGSRYVRDHGANVTFRGGVRLRFVNLSAHASMTEQTSEIVRPTRNSWICGDDENLDRSSQIAVKPRLRKR